MTVLYESIWPAVLSGGVLLFFLVCFWLISKKTVLLGLSLLPLTVIVGGIYLEQSVETDQEAIQRTFDCIAAGLQQERMSDVERYLTPDAKETLSRVKWAIDRLSIRKVGIYDTKIEINDFTSPPIATAQFHGVVKYTLKNQSGANAEIYSAHFTVELEKQEGNREVPWLVNDHIEYGGGF